MIGKYNRIVNLSYVVDGLHFDAAIDCDWELHAYGIFGKDKCDETPIELYCIDHPEWDIRMMYHKEPDGRRTNDQQGDVNWYLHTAVDMEEIIAETKAWIREIEQASKNEKE